MIRQLQLFVAVVGFCLFGVSVLALDMKQLEGLALFLYMGLSFLFVTSLVVLEIYTQRQEREGKSTACFVSDMGFEITYLGFWVGSFLGFALTLLLKEVL